MQGVPVVREAIVEAGERVEEAMTGRGLRQNAGRATRASHARRHSTQRQTDGLNRHPRWYRQVCAKCVQEGAAG